MQSYAYLFLACGLTSACFTDRGVVKSVSGGAKLLAIVFGVLFLATEGLSIFGY